MLTRIACIALLLTATTPLIAQEICATTPEGLAAARRAIAEIEALARPVVPAQGLWPLDEKIREMNQFPPKPLTTPWGTPVPPNLYGQVIPKQKREKETRFSWWGYGHDELHAKDPNDPKSFSVIDELEAKFGKNACCNGLDQGECRITKFEEDPNPSSTNTKKRVIVDGEACDIRADTQFTALNSFKRPGYIVVCAAKTYRSSTAAKGTATCSTYCIGTAGGF